MTMTNEEKLELAKQKGAVTAEDMVSFWHDEFLAYTSAIEEKYQAQIAGLRDASKTVVEHFAGKNAEHASISKLREALSTTQATSDAFIAEVKAAERKSTLDELRRRLSENDETAAWNIDDMAADIKK